MQQVAILGLGLIGGSLGLALHENTALRISGWDRDPQVIAQALARAAIHEGSAALHETVQAADLVIVATPVLAVRTLFEAIAPHLKAGAIVTDVASTKAEVVQWARSRLPAQVVFVGGHPMAGGEQHGIRNARADLLRGAAYCLTPTADTPPGAVDTLHALFAGLGARLLIMSPEDHDRHVAAISHLPFVLSAALVQLTASHERWAEMRQLAATGYRDVTRLASGDPTMHRDICLTNAAAITPLLHEFAHLLTDLADHLHDPQALHEFFGAAQERRAEWLHEREQHSVNRTAPRS